MANGNNQDPISKLYAEWVSATVRLSVSGFDATAKLLEASMQSAVALKAKAKNAEAKGAGAKETAATAAAPVGETKPEPVKAKAPARIAAKADKPNAAAAPKAKAAPAAKPSAKADDLKLISGIGPRLEQVLQKRGITGFAKIAAMKAADIAKLDEELGLNGRIQRDDWVGQAAKLAG